MFKKGKNKILFLAVAVIFLAVFLYNNAYAHPGRTASDGCHYCRTNCAKWGEVAGARHCHGGYIAPKPTPKPTPKPVVPVPEPVVPESNIIEEQEEVKGENTEENKKEEVKTETSTKELGSTANAISDLEDSGSGFGGGLALGALGAGILAWYLNKKKNEKKDITS